MFYKKPLVFSLEYYGVKLTSGDITFSDKFVVYGRYRVFLRLTWFSVVLVSSSNMSFKYTCILLLVSMVFLLAQAKNDKKEKTKQNGENDNLRTKTPSCFRLKNPDLEY